jgi:hypothetical protein
MHTQTRTSGVDEPAAAAAVGVAVLQQGHKVPLQQTEVLFLAAVALPLQLVELGGRVLGQQPHAVRLCLMLHLLHLDHQDTKQNGRNRMGRVDLGLVFFGRSLRFGSQPV